MLLCKKSLFSEGFFRFLQAFSGLQCNATVWTWSELRPLFVRACKDKSAGDIGKGLELRWIFKFILKYRIYVWNHIDKEDKKWYNNKNNWFAFIFCHCVRKSERNAGCPAFFTGHQLVFANGFRLGKEGADFQGNKNFLKDEKYFSKWCLISQWARVSSQCGAEHGFRFQKPVCSCLRTPRPRFHAKKLRSDHSEMEPKF